jgi:hypothetical protein
MQTPNQPRRLGNLGTYDDESQNRLRRNRFRTSHNGFAKLAGCDPFPVNRSLLLAFDGSD